MTLTEKSAVKLKHNTNAIKHGEHGTALYKKWKSMRGRVRSHPHYLDNNIKCCSEWDDYMEFKLWAVNSGWKNGLSLDRINTYKDYTPDNCRWVDKSVQAANIRIKSNNTSGYNGVSFNKQKQKYIAQVRYNKKATYLGQYNNAKTAAIAFDTYVKDNNLPHTLNFGGHYEKCT